MKKTNLIDIFISPVTGAPRVIDIKAATLSQGKVWLGDASNTPEEADLNGVILNTPMRVWTTQTRPTNPSGTILGLNIKYR